MGFENGIFQLINLIPMYYWRKQKKTLITGLKEKNKFHLFSTKAYVVGTQKICLNEMVFLSTKSIC